MNNSASRLKVAELTSGVGALVLGVGLGAHFSHYLSTISLAALIVGAVMHGWGMYNKHQLERGGSRIGGRWEAALYWLCWILLAIIGLYILFRR